MTAIGSSMINSTHNAGCLIIHNGKFLAVKDASGKWDIPAGKSELEETPEQTARRETLEETGLSIKVLKLIKAFPDKEDKLFYLCLGELIDKTISSENKFNVPKGEQQKITEITFLDIETLNESNARFPQIVKAFKEIFYYYQSNANDQ